MRSRHGSPRSPALAARSRRDASESRSSPHSCDNALGAQRGDLGLAVAVLAQYLVAVLADPRGAARRHLFLAGEEEGAIDRPQIGIVGVRLEKTGGDDLLVVPDILDAADNAEDQPGIVERLAPVSEVMLGEQLVEDGHELAPMPGSERAGGTSSPARTRSISPVRAHHAVASKPGLFASGPVSP